MEGIRPILEREYLGSPVQAWLTALVVALILWGVFLGVRRATAAGVGRLVKRTAVAWDDLLVELIPRTHAFFLLSLAVLVGSTFLDRSATTVLVLRKVVVVLGVLQFGRWANCAIDFAVRTHRERKVSADPAAVTSINALGLVARIGVAVLVVLLILSNLGVQITPLLAGLGVGSLAVALAVQTVLKDLLASFSIILDKPFVVGDFLILGDLMGSVEHIGLKTTRIRSLSGEQLVFSNNDLLESRIRNFGRMRERRATFTIGVTYQTSREKLARIPGMLKAAVEAQEKTRFDRSHFKTYGSFSIDFETVYYVAVPDMTKYLDIQQAINLHIHEQFEKEGIEFAYPTQTIWLGQPEAATAKLG